MRYSKHQQAETAARVRAGVSRAFRKHGYAGVGVDGLAQEGGATAGAFYSNFGSKDEAFAFAVDQGMRELLEGVRSFRSRHGANWLKEFLSWYLGADHRKDVACGCALASLSPEIARAGPRVRSIYAKWLSAIIEEVAAGLANGSEEQRRDRARAVLALLAGAVTISRAVETERDAAMIAAAAATMAEAALGVR